MSKQIVSIIQIVLAIFLVSLILLQSKGTGLGSTFGAEGALYRTRRGAEKIFFYLTIIVSFLFVIASVVGLLT